jgi:putative N6-adenine-specific DNA methylase
VVHKAAADRLCARHKIARLPENGKVAEVRVYIEKDMVSLLLDLSGEPLFKRGYRSEGGIAPLRETTAAAMLLLSGWKRKFPLYDPFCGSGTVLIEAAMYAWDMAPGLGRGFALEGLSIANGEIEQAIREEFRGKIDFQRLIRIAGSDEDTRTVSIAKSNVERLRDLAEGRVPVKGIRAAGGKTGPIELKTLPMTEARPCYPESDEKLRPEGFIITNPPYGKRLGDQQQSEQTYREMEGLRQRFPDWKLALITDHSGFESFFGTKAGSCRPISNGAIPSYFFQYELL